VSVCALLLSNRADVRAAYQFNLEHEFEGVEDLPQNGKYVVRA
jgi:hypothetical protein